MADTRTFSTRDERPLSAQTANSYPLRDRSKHPQFSPTQRTLRPEPRPLHQDRKRTPRQRCPSHRCSRHGSTALQPNPAHTTHTTHQPNPTRPSLRNSHPIPQHPRSDHQQLGHAISRTPKRRLRYLECHVRPPPHRPRPDIQDLSTPPQRLPQRSFCLQHPQPLRHHVGQRPQVWARCTVLVPRSYRKRQTDSTLLLAVLPLPKPLVLLLSLAHLHPLTQRAAPSEQIEMLTVIKVLTSTHP